MSGAWGNSGSWGFGNSVSNGQQGFTPAQAGGHPTCYGGSNGWGGNASPSSSQGWGTGTGHGYGNQASTGGGHVDRDACQWGHFGNNSNDGGNYGGGWPGSNANGGWNPDQSGWTGHQQSYGFNSGAEEQQFQSLGDMTVQEKTYPCFLSRRSSMTVGDKITVEDKSARTKSMSLWRKPEEAKGKSSSGFWEKHVDEVLLEEIGRTPYESWSALLKKQ